MYLRVSTRDQKFDSQEKILLDFCRRRGWKKFTYYREKASGSGVPRTVLNRLMEDARSGKIDVVAVYKLDRFGRSLIHLLQLVKELSTRKIGFVTATQPIDTTAENPMAELLLSIFGFLGEQEGDRIRERTADGLAAARRKGRIGGRPRNNNENIAAAFKLRGKKQQREIAKITGLSESYVSKLFKGEPVK